jgi:hypothetical protein
MFPVAARACVIAVLFPVFIAFIATRVLIHKIPQLTDGPVRFRTYPVRVWGLTSGENGSCLDIMLRHKSVHVWFVMS